MKLQFLYEDEHLVIVDKPARVLSVPDRYNTSLPNLKGILRKRFGEIWVVHRLDFETSGAIIYAKTEEAHAALQQLMESGGIEKRYHALCLAPIEPEGEILAPIGPDRSTPNLYHVHKRGKAAHTRYQVIERIGRWAWVDIQILTGRTHQIRVHMKHIGAPLFVDKSYGYSEAFYLSSIKRIRLSKGKEERPLLHRVSLHAYSLGFTHPISGEKIAVQSPLPKDLKATLHQLRKHA